MEPVKVENKQTNKQPVESLSLSDVDLNVIEEIEEEERRYASRKPRTIVIHPAKEHHSYPFLKFISTISLDMCGSDRSQRIELFTLSGRKFKTELASSWLDQNYFEVKGRKQFNIYNGKDDKLLSVDFSKDRKSFHIMEPNSDTFIAFFTLTGSSNTTVDIHNVIDGEIYYAISSEKPDRIVIKASNGEEMGLIYKPETNKWTQYLSGTFSLNFTGDDRDGLNTREKAILLGYLIALGVNGMDYWKRTSSGLLTFYFLCFIFFTILAVFMYLRYRDGIPVHRKMKQASNKTLEQLNSTRL